MSTNVPFNGVIYPIPVQGDRNWAPPLTRFLVAVGNGSFQTTGGLFTLSADANFGTSFGLLSKYFTSITSTPATAGVLRLAKTDSVGWKNNAGNGNLLLAIDGTDQLTFNGVQIGASASLAQNHIYVGNASNQPADVAMSGDATIVSSGALTIANGAITDVKVNASAAIAVSKLAALTASKAVATDSSGFITASTTTSTELGYVSGVTSAIQTQINNINASSVPTGSIVMYGTSSAPSGWLLCDGSAVSRSTYSTLFALIGVTFGSGNGSTTFNVPNFTNNVPVGAGSIAALGASAGSATHTLTQAELPTALGTASSVVTDPGHTHTTSLLSASVGGGSHATVYSFDNNEDGTKSPASNSSVTGITVATTITNGSGGNAHSIVQPSLGITYIIKT